ncbi:MAG: PAS domain-containing protein [Halapricum sp.]
MGDFDEEGVGLIRVLYVNDDSAFSDLVRTKLPRINGSLDVTVVADAETAMDYLGTATVDCVVASYSLPDGTGIDFLEDVQARYDDLPTVLFTGRGSEEVASQAMRVDISDYIPIRSNQESFELLARRIQTLVDAVRKQAVADRMKDRYQRTLERTTDAVYALDNEWRIEYMNEKMGTRADRDPESVVGNTLWEEFPSIEGTELEDRYRTAMKSGEPVSFEQYVDEPFEYWVQIRAFPDEDGLTVFSREISSERDRDPRQLAEEYDALLASSGDAIFILDVDRSGPDVDFRFARLSPGYETQTGLTTEEVRNKTPRDVFGDERGSELAANYRDCLERGEPVSYQEELPVADDARFWETSLAPVAVDDTVTRIVGIARNVTERVQREQELQRTNQRLESLIEAAPHTILEIDSKGDVLLWNQGAEEMFGWDRAEVVGEFNPIVPDDKQSEFADLRQRVLDGTQIRGKEIQRESKQGKKLDLLLSAAPIMDPDGKKEHILAVLEDITEQKRLEEQLRSLQETAQQLSRARASEAIAEIGIDAAADVLGFEIAGVWEAADQRDALVPIASTTAARELFGEAPTFMPGNSLAWDAFESGELRVYDNVQTLEQSHNPETEIKSEIQVPLGEYGLISAGSTSSKVFSDTDVDLFRILGATLEAAFARASREQKLERQNERLDQFASVVAHDLRNPLTVAIGFLEVAAETGDPEHFEKIESAHDRIERLIEDLLALARGNTTVEDAEQIDLKRVAREAWGYVDTHEATINVSETVPVVTGDVNRLTQLFENLFRNAVEHGGNDVSISVGTLDDETGFYVADDGEGIPVENRETVFEHGVTSSQGGTGFGLSIVDDIARAHGWTVSVTDSIDGGARFEFETFPD